MPVDILVLSHGDYSDYQIDYIFPGECADIVESYWKANSLDKTGTIKCRKAEKELAIKLGLKKWSGSDLKAAYLKSLGFKELTFTEQYP